jgi:hypothetical protein
MILILHYEKKKQLRSSLQKNKKKNNEPKLTSYGLSIQALLLYCVCVGESGE